MSTSTPPIAPHRIDAMRTRIEWLEGRLQQREEVISTLVDKNVELLSLHERAVEREARLLAQRDACRRLFNRFDAAVTHHYRDTHLSFSYCDDADDRLHAARDRIVGDSAGIDW